MPANWSDRPPELAAPALRGAQLLHSFTLSPGCGPSGQATHRAAHAWPAPTCDDRWATVGSPACWLQPPGLTPGRCCRRPRAEETEAAAPAGTTIASPSGCLLGRSFAFPPGGRGRSLPRPKPQLRPAAHPGRGRLRRGRGRQRRRAPFPALCTGSAAGHGPRPQRIAAGPGARPGDLRSSAGARQGSGGRGCSRRRAGSAPPTRAERPARITPGTGRRCGAARTAAGRPRSPVNGPRPGPGPAQPPRPPAGRTGRGKRTRARGPGGETEHAGPSRAEPGRSRTHLPPLTAGPRLRPRHVPCAPPPRAACADASAPSAGPRPQERTAGRGRTAPPSPPTPPPTRPPPRRRWQQSQDSRSAVTLLTPRYSNNDRRPPRPVACALGHPRGEPSSGPPPRQQAPLAAAAAAQERQLCRDPTEGTWAAPGPPRLTELAPSRSGRWTRPRAAAGPSSLPYSRNSVASRTYGQELRQAEASSLYGRSQQQRSFRGERELLVQQQARHTEELTKR